ncbi:hypothetical protein PInf_025620 [Phytophthora infestans]|nr:hypothetical protein PInf_025620 [Phytophthora infestans]
MEMEDELAAGVVLSPTRNLSKDGEIVRRWMEMVLGDKSLGDLPAALHSGELLCDLINKLYKALGMKSQISPVRAQGDDMDAWSNVREYLRACEVLGVARQDLFQPEDLLSRKDMEKDGGSVALKSPFDRRRSSMINAPDWSPVSEHGVFADDEDLDAEDLDLDSPEAVNIERRSEIVRVIPLRLRTGPLAHGIWRTEERIRAILMREDRDFGAVPEELHGKLWMLASGAQLEMRKSEGQYERLLASESESTEATRQIDVDLHRTVANEDKELWTEEKSRMMRRVLVAYSIYNPGLGYCQGLNYIVARSLQYLGEEEAFYLLVVILGLAVDQHVFADLVRLQYPEISEHLSELGGSGMELSLACTEWFLTLFASPCERGVTFQIWDAIFLQGDEVLFRVALALLQPAKTALLACNNYGDMLKHLNELGRGIFRHIDRIPPRLARTFDRKLTEDYMETIRQDHPNFAQYYEGLQPQIIEMYWGSADSYRQWGARNVRRISTDGFAVSSSKDSEGHHVKEEINIMGDHQMSPNVSGERRRELTRDRRSKSFMHPKKSNTQRKQHP